MKMSMLACKKVAGFAAGIIAGVALSQLRRSTGAAHARGPAARRKTVQGGILPRRAPGQQTEADRQEATQTLVTASGKRQQRQGKIENHTGSAEPDETATGTFPTQKPKDSPHDQTEASSGNTAPDVAPGRRGGKRAQGGGQNLTKQQLYHEARKRNIRGRSTMTKAELQRALG
jgi:hypothetical protein